MTAAAVDDAAAALAGLSDRHFREALTVDLSPTAAVWAVVCASPELRARALTVLDVVITKAEGHGTKGAAGFAMMCRRRRNDVVTAERAARTAAEAAYTAGEGAKPRPAAFSTDRAARMVARHVELLEAEKRDTSTLRFVLRRVLHAVNAQRAAVEADPELEPSPEDLALWKLLDPAALTADLKHPVSAENVRLHVEYLAGSGFPPASPFRPRG